MDTNSTWQGLERFVEAQDRVYASVLVELADGNKTSHWMWFVFPQLKALGRSSIAKHNKAISPSIAPKRDATSALVKTEGIRLGRVGRWTSVRQGKSIASTSR